MKKDANTHKVCCNIKLGVDEEIQQFYGKGNMMPYLGSNEFRSWVYRKHITDERVVFEQEKFMFRPEMDDIINWVQVFLV